MCSLYSEDWLNLIGETCFLYMNIGLADTLFLYTPTIPMIAAECVGCSGLLSTFVLRKPSHIIYGTRSIGKPLNRTRGDR